MSEDPDERTDAGSSVYGCRANRNNGDEILKEIAARLEEDFLKPGMPCTTTLDCSQTLITPACDFETSTCVPCPDPLQQALFGVGLAGCLVAEARRCCRDRAARPDCIVRACATGCGGR